MTTKNLTVELLETLVRNGRVRSMSMMRDLKKGWILHVEHRDDEIGPLLYTQRGDWRVFKTIDSLTNVVCASGFDGPLVVHYRSGGR